MRKALSGVLAVLLVAVALVGTLHHHIGQPEWKCDWCTVTHHQNVAAPPQVPAPPVARPFAAPSAPAPMRPLPSDVLAVSPKTSPPSA